MKNLLNVATHMLGQASCSDSTRQNQSCTKRTRHDRNVCNSSFKGVVALLSGNWAAHVCVNHSWICIGIFKTEEEAVMAYENRTIKLWIEYLSRYLQKTSNTAHKPNIQKQARIDGAHLSRSVNNPQMHGEQKFTHTRLFEKVLTPSDVSKLNRIVIPKMYASFFSCIASGNTSISDVQEVNAVELGFYDRSMTLWKFQYSYWKGSKTHVFSKGWRHFVRAKQLSSKDKVIFVKCEHVETTSVVHMYFVIDVEYHANRVQVEEASGSMGEYAVTNGEEFHSNERVQNLDNEQNRGGTACTRHEMNIDVDSDFKRTESAEAPETGFKLFGVKLA